MRKSRVKSNVARAISQFEGPGRLAEIIPISTGNVNDTYLAIFKVGTAEERRIIQRINRHVFSRPDWIIENMKTVTEHAQRRLDREAGSADRVWQIPRLLSSKGGHHAYVDPDGEWWRSMTVILSASSYDVAQGTQHAMEAGTVLGQFHRLVSDLNPALLRDTLPGFHVTPEYLKAYDATLKTTTARKRLQSTPGAESLTRFVESHREMTTVLENALRRGELIVRLIHGDPKINNIMVDNVTGRGTSIVDLDTVKPGLIQYDFGDALRSICNPAGEEVEDLSDVEFDANLCEAFVQGYMSRAAEFLSDADHKYLYDCIRLITFELGLRFFEDYLAGDVYFKVRHSRHNLQRARVQFRLCESIEAREAAIRRILRQ